MGNKLTPKAQRFIDEYCVDMNGTQAAIRAGYSKRSARQIADQNLSKHDIREAIMKRRKELSEASFLDAVYVLEGFKENFERAMTAVPVLDRDGAKTGEYVYQGAVANRALELIGKHLGMFKERLEHSGPDSGPIRHQRTIADIMGE